MKLIQLTQVQCTKVDDVDCDWLSQWEWHAFWNPDTQSFYAKRSTPRDKHGKQTTIRMHRAILGLGSGDKRQGDHKNGDTLDNRRENLRVVTPRQNAQNHASHRAGRLVGATLNKRTNRWFARLRIGKKVRYLGHFATEQEAHKAYQVALFGLSA